MLREFHAEEMSSNGVLHCQESGYVVRESRAACADAAQQAPEVAVFPAGS